MAMAGLNVLSSNNNLLRAGLVRLKGGMDYAYGSVIKNSEEYTMNYNKNKIILTAVVAVLLVVLAVLVIIALTSLNDQPPAATRPNHTTAATEPADSVEDHIIETPYCDIRFPGQYAEYLKVERTESPDLTLDFIAELDSGKVQKLFTLRFGAAEVPAVGQVTSKDGVAVGVYVTSYEFNPDGTWPVKEATAVDAMMESLNAVLKSMKISDLGTPIPEVEGDEIVIDTPYCKLYMPSVWAEELTVTVDQSDGYMVTFFGTIADHEALPLFAVNFGGGEGQVVHTLYTENDVPYFVRVKAFDLEIQDWNAVDQSTAKTMKEDINYLLGKLREE